jgi:hypothetical protein
VDGKKRKKTKHSEDAEKEESGMEIQNEIIDLETENEMKEINKQEGGKVFDLTVDPHHLQENDRESSMLPPDCASSNGGRGRKGKKRSANGTFAIVKEKKLPIFASQTEGVSDASTSPRESIFSNLPLDSIEIPTFPRSSSVSETIEFPLRSSSLHDWNISHDVTSTNNFFPLPPSFWLDEFPDDPHPGDFSEIAGSQLRVPEVTSPQVALPQESSPLPLLSISNSRSWSPVRSPAPQMPVVPPNDLRVVAASPEDKVVPMRSPDDDEKAMNSFIHKFLHLSSSVTMESSGDTSHRSHKGAGREFIASLPSLSSIRNSSPVYSSTVSFPLRHSSSDYKNPTDLLTSRVNGDDHPLSSTLFPSDQTLTHSSSPTDNSTTTIDFSEYFSPDEINDIMSLIHDDPDTFLPETPAAPAAPIDTQTLISDQSIPLSQLTLYRTTVSKRGRKKRKFDSQPARPSSKRSTSPQEPGPGPGQDDHSIKTKQRRKTTISQRTSRSIPQPGDEYYLPHQLNALNQGHEKTAQDAATSLSPQSADSNLSRSSSFFSLSYPPLGSEDQFLSNPEAKLQGLVGLKLVLNSVTKPPFSHLVSRPHITNSPTIPHSYHPSSNLPNHDPPVAVAASSRDHSGGESWTPHPMSSSRNEPSSLCRPSTSPLPPI